MWQFSNRWVYVQRHRLSTYTTMGQKEELKLACLAELSSQSKMKRQLTLPVVEKDGWKFNKVENCGSSPVKGW